jgi:alkylation response protein AidB-like acyl-CoA dehydrogenase
VEIGLSAEQEMFAAAVASLAADVTARWSLGRGPDSVSPPEPDARSWRDIADAGLLSLRLDPSAGGSAASCLDVCVAAEQLGRLCVPAPVLGTLLLVEQLRLRGADPQLLGPVASGERRAAVALRADLLDFAADAGDARAFDCAGATTTIVLSDRAVCFPVQAARSADLTRSFGVPDAEQPGPSFGLSVPASAAATGRLISFALSLISADLLGVMQAALDAAVAHAKSRTQFGSPVGSFQAIAHLAAECLVSVEATRSAVWYSAWAADELPPPQAVLVARAAKAFASAAAVTVTEAAVQIHGGMGMTWEARPHVWLRRAQADRRLLGDENAQYAAIAATQLGVPATGTEA